jgi:hypothetical protein
MHIQIEEAHIVGAYLLLKAATRALEAPDPHLEATSEVLDQAEALRKRAEALLEVQPRHTCR